MALDINSELFFYSGPCNVLMVGSGATLDKVIDEANKKFRGSHQIVAAATDVSTRIYYKIIILQLCEMYFIYI